MLSLSVRGKRKERKEMLSKSLRLCCMRLKRTSTTTPQNSQNPLHVPSSASAPSSPVFKNFNCLYDPAAAASDSETLTGFGFGSGSGSTSQTVTTITADEEEEDNVTSDAEPDLSTIIASRRLLRPASTGRSNSIVDDGDRSGFGAVPKMSPDPYGDFKRSMEEMVAALGLIGEGQGEGHQRHQLSGAQLQELLLCYLALNRKSAHKYIVGAFTDLLRSLSTNGN